MIKDEPDVDHFFDNYSEFYNTSKTKAFPNRLNTRYLALIDSNKQIIEGSSILDLGSHDGRWSFAAIKNGARHVLGIEGKKHLVENSYATMRKYGIPLDKYSFITGDMFHEIKNIEQGTIDVVFCFGVFYHVMNHMTLLSEVKRLKPKYLLLDTKISTSDLTVIELKIEDSKIEGAALPHMYGNNEQVVVGYPSKSALELMLTNLGFSFFYYDWHNAGIENWENIQDYQENRRISLLANNLSC